MRGINPKVTEHFHHAQEKYDVWVTMLYGSQNYGLSTPDSDVDVKTMIFPSIEDVVLGKKMVSLDLEHPYDGSLNNVKDYRAMFNNYLKGNINFIETLYTPWFVVNPVYEEEFFDLKRHRELIANSQPRKLVHMAAGMANQKYAAMEKPFESKKDVLNIYGYDFKQLHHLIRLYFFIREFITTGSFEKSLRPIDSIVRDFLMGIKTDPYSLAVARNLKEYYMKEIDNLVEWADKNLPEEQNRKEAKEYLDELALTLFKKRYILS